MFSRDFSWLIAWSSVDTTITPNSIRSVGCFGGTDRPKPQLQFPRVFLCQLSGASGHFCRAACDSGAAADGRRWGEGCNIPGITRVSGQRDGREAGSIHTLCTRFPLVHNGVSRMSAPALVRPLGDIGSCENRRPLQVDAPVLWSANISNSSWIKGSSRNDPHGAVQ